MANDVFANGLEIACKAADGKAIACFPDVCFTPPSPPAGWIPIPYANTAYAKDTANASKTVFISGKPVMKKDVSYFKTSTGNEPAAGPKGVITHVKKGKAYFASWSMNVKIEGENVDRHTDMTTHNHGSTSNTATWVYSDTGTKPPSACEKDCERIEMACGHKVNRHQAKKMCKTGDVKAKPATEAEKQKEAQKQKEAEKNKKESSKPSTGKKSKGDYASKFISKFKEFFLRSKNWKLRHCGILMVKSCAKKEDIDKNIEEIDKQLAELEKFLEELPGKAKDAAQQLISEIEKDLLNDILVKAVIGWDMSGGIWKGVGKFIFKKVPYVGQAVSAVEAGIYIKQATDIIDMINTSVGQYLELIKKEVKEKIEKIKKAKEDLKKLKDGGKEGKKAFLDAQALYADANPCIKARKCNLIPFSKTESEAKKDKISASKKDEGKKAAKKKEAIGDEGCCPGQTGHHVVPGSVLSKKQGGKRINELNCSKYDHDAAPTVCTEGKDQNECTHKAEHDCGATRAKKKIKNIYKENKEIVERNKTLPDSEKIELKTFKLDDAISAFAQCHFDTHLGCHQGCIKQQLRKYYNDVCDENNKTVRTVDGNTRAAHTTDPSKNDEKMGAKKRTPKKKRI